ncbi:MAG: AAA family ATPase [Myxococcota bacterium]
MSRIHDALRRAGALGARRRRDVGRLVELEPTDRASQVVAVTSNKGGVGKTTLAMNLAVYLRALQEDLPILVMSLDDQPMTDRMFALGDEPSPDDIESAVRSGDLTPAVRLGQYGVHYVPGSRSVTRLVRELDDPFRLQKMLGMLDWRGIVIVDTKSDFEILTQNAIAASDLTMIVVADHASLIEAQRVFDLLEQWNRPRERARVVLSMIDLRIKYREGADGDILGLLIHDIRERGYPLFESFLSRSPKVESLHTNPEWRAASILHGASGSLVNQQMRHIAEDVLKALPHESAAPAAVRLRGLTPEAALGLPVNPLPIESLPFSIGRRDALVQSDLMIPDSKPWRVSRRHALLVEENGRVGVLDTGSKLGSIVDGQRIGGRSGNRGPVFFSGEGGTLTLGSNRSPFRYEIALSP